MRSRSYRFTTGIPTDTGQDLIDFENAEEGHIHNPWPELVDHSDPHHAGTQPLVLARYLSTTRPDELPHGNLVRHIVNLHEYVHVWLGYTPAKQWARVCLSETYAAVTKLLDVPGDRWNSQAGLAWAAFTEWSAALWETLKHSVLAEELLATSLSFKMAKWQLPRRVRDISALESRWVSLQVTVLDEISRGMGTDFKKLYGNDQPSSCGFTKVAELLIGRFCDPDAIPSLPIDQDFLISYDHKAHFTRVARDVAWLGIFLEPISGYTALSNKLGFWQEPLPQLDQVDDPRPNSLQVIDSKERCDRLAAALTQIKSYRQLMRWRDRSVKGEDCWGPYLATSALSVKSAQSNPFMRRLWRLAYASDLPRWDRRALRATVPTQSPLDQLPRGPMLPVPLPDLLGASFPYYYAVAPLELYPRNIDGLWYVIPFWPPFDSVERLAQNVPTRYPRWALRHLLAMGKDYTEILAVEAFRQQLVTGSRIRCPWCSIHMERLDESLHLWHALDQDVSLTSDEQTTDIDTIARNRGYDEGFENIMHGEAAAELEASGGTVAENRFRFDIALAYASPHPDTKHRVNRLARWAKRGRFGRGEWSRDRGIPCRSMDT